MNESESRTIVVTTIGTGVALAALFIGVTMNQNLRLDDLRRDVTAAVDDLRRDSGTVRDRSARPSRQQSIPNSRL